MTQKDDDMFGFNWGGISDNGSDTDVAGGDLPAVATPNPLAMFGIDPEAIKKDFTEMAGPLLENFQAKQKAQTKAAFVEALEETGLLGILKSLVPSDETKGDE